MSRHQGSRGSIAAGVVLIGIGAVFLLERLDFVSRRQVWRLWPMFVIWWGLVRLVKPEGGRRTTFPLLLGIWLQISVLGLWGFDFGDSWPILLIFLGTSFVFDALFSPSPRRRDGLPRNEPDGD